MSKYKHELIMCIVNEGFSEAVMDAARAVGAMGGTVVNVHGTANKVAEKFFSITIQPEKEMVMILVSSDIKEAVLHALYKAVGLNTPGHGIAFAVPVDNVVGLTDKKLKESVGEEKPSKEKSLVETAPKDDEPQAESEDPKSDGENE